MIDLSDRLAYRTAPHPSWQPHADWPEQVGWVLYRHPASMVLIDPLVRGDRDPHAWSQLDAEVRAAAGNVCVLLTAPWHVRSTREVVDRYQARVWTAPAARAGVSNLPELDELPAGIRVFVPRGVHEGQVAFLLEPEQALVVAELFIGTGDGLEVCPSPATDDKRQFIDSLRELEAMEIRRVLVSHGPPVLEGGRDAISAALRAFAVAY
jgi:glyoxylase-like metal-dependent hydrolase (beta-lactamase superfamily II)